MSGVGPTPCSAATSFNRASPPAAAGTATIARAARTAAGMVKRSISRVMGSASEDLVQDAKQPARRQAVFHEPAAEVTNAQFAQRGRRDRVARADVSATSDAGQHDNLAVAVDLDFA